MKGFFIVILFSTFLSCNNQTSYSDFDYYSSTTTTTFPDNPSFEIIFWEQTFLSVDVTMDGWGQHFIAPDQWGDVTVDYEITNTGDSDISNYFVKFLYDTTSDQKTISNINFTPVQKGTTLNQTAIIDSGNKQVISLKIDSFGPNSRYANVKVKYSGIAHINNYSVFFTIKYIDSTEEIKGQGNSYYFLDGRFETDFPVQNKFVESITIHHFQEKF